MRRFRTASLVSSMLLSSVSAAFAQTAPPLVQASKPAAESQPVRLFPADARFAFIDFQRVAQDSAPGKLAARILKEFGDKKRSEIDGQNKQLQAMTAKKDTGDLSGPALAQVAKDVDRLQREIQFAQQSAQVEFQQMREELEGDLQKKVIPVVADLAKERSLHAVFTADSGLFYLLPALDISDEVIKRVSAPPKKGGEEAR